MLDDFVEHQTRTLRGNKVLIGLRLLLATVSLTVLLIQESDMARRALTTSQLEPPLYMRPPGLVAIIVCALTILYVLAARRSESTPNLAPKLAFLQIFADIFLVSALVWNTGGVDSQFVVLYLISICSAAIVLKYNVAILAAAVAATLFSVVTLLYSIGIVPVSIVQVERLRDLSLLNFVRLLLLPVCAFFLTGFLAGTLSRRLVLAKLLHDEILEGIGEGILVVDVRRMAIYHNRELQRLLGLRESLAGRPLAQLLGNTIDRHVSDTLAANSPHRIEVSHKRLDGMVIPFIVRMIPIRESDGGPARGVILALDDITAEKKMEEFLKHRQRIETMGHISATIAHEIRNPLASIRGAVQEIGRSLQIPENKRVLLEIVLSESDRLDQIITDFLRFARMRPPKLTATDMGRVLADVKILLNSRPESKGIAISLAGDEGEPFPADPEQLRQLFLNLGVNALQAMDGLDRRELAMRVRVVSLHRAPGFGPDIFERVDRPGVMVELEDTGKGMPSSVSSQIFEPFFTTKATGTGLGLAIVERIVQSHEGIIAVRSKEGQGTTFSIWLPTDLKVGAAAVSGPRPAVV